MSWNEYELHDSMISLRSNGNHALVVILETNLFAFTIAVVVQNLFQNFSHLDYKAS